jgi:hypothetical protein
MNGSSIEPVRPWFRSASGWAWIGFAAIAAFYLFTEHRAHLLGALPFAIFLLCPLLHVFHHRGHGGHEGHESQGPAEGSDPGRATAAHHHHDGGPDQ